jgi:hypothetical protein
MRGLHSAALASLPGAVRARLRARLARSFVRTIPDEDVAIEGEIRDDPFQFAVFVAQRPQLAELRQAEPGKLPLPAVERLLADAEPATDLGDFFAALGLVEGLHHGHLKRWPFLFVSYPALFAAETALLHGILFAVRPFASSVVSSSIAPRKRREC